jgi:hypothetical protein
MNLMWLLVITVTLSGGGEPIEVELTKHSSLEMCEQERLAAVEFFIRRLRENGERVSRVVAECRPVKQTI